MPSDRRGPWALHSPLLRSLRHCQYYTSIGTASSIGFARLLSSNRVSIVRRRRSAIQLQASVVIEITVLNHYMDITSQLC